MCVIYYLLSYEDYPYEGARYKVRVYEECTTVPEALNKATRLIALGFGVVIEPHTR